MGSEGGSISVESDFGKGSSFTASFNFTVLEEAEDEGLDSLKMEASEPGQPVVLGERYPLKVLVAEDNPMVRRLIVQYLESMGYAPDQVSGGKPASEKGGAYDLVVTDLRMPGMDGPTAASIIREKSGLEDQPWIVGVSASLEQSEIDRAINLGINDFLGKPFFAGDLEQRIRSIPWLEDLADVNKQDSENERSDQVESSPLEEEKSATSFASRGMGVFSKEMVESAMNEVRTLCEKMEPAIKNGNFDFVSDKAHYISNTAMAIGIEQLYIDSRALQAAAESELGECRELLNRLKKNFEGWELS